MPEPVIKGFGVLKRAAAKVRGQPLLLLDDSICTLCNAAHTALLLPCQWWMWNSLPSFCFWRRAIKHSIAVNRMVHIRNKMAANRAVYTIAKSAKPSTCCACICAGQHGPRRAGPKDWRRCCEGSNRGGRGEVGQPLPISHLANRQRHAEQHERKRGHRKQVGRGAESLAHFDGWCSAVQHCQRIVVWQLALLCLQPI
jgi:hypothetical protein